MILMNWIRSDDGGFTAFHMRMRRVRLARYVHEQLIAHMQAIYCHEQTALALYRELAARATISGQRDLFLRLAQTEARRIARRTEIFERLNVPVPCCGSRLGRLGQQILIRLGARYVLAWIRFIKRGDIRRQMALARMLKSLSG